MNRPTKSFSLLVISLFLLTSPLVNACEKTVRVIDFPPYSVKKEGTWEGLNISISQQLLNSIGCSASYISLPFARALALLKTGEVDMLLQLTETEKRKKYAHFIGPIYDEVLILATREKITYPLRNLTDIAENKLHIAIQRGLHMGTDFQDRYDEDIKFRESFVILSAVEPLLPMVKKRRLDGFFIDELHFDYMKKSNPDFAGMSKQPFAVHKSEVYVGLSKKSFSISEVNKVKERFYQLKRNGSLTSLQNKYLAEHLK